MEAKLTSITCNHCGAPLQVPETTRFLTCSYCGTRLEVHRSGNAVYTEVLANIEQRTQQIAQDVEHIKRQNEIERLDREWQMRRDSLLIRSKDGHVHEPSSVGGVVGGLIGVVGGIIWMVFAASMGAPGVFVLFGVLFIVVAAIGAIGSVSKASEYKHAEENYHRQRQSLLRSQQDRP